MCICLNCERIKTCNIFFLIEQKHEEKNKRTINNFFFPQAPILSCINFFSKKKLYLFEWDVNECLSYQEKAGNWLSFYPKMIEPSSYLMFDILF